MNMESNYSWWERAGAVLGGGFATLSKNPDRFAFGLAPIVLARGNGCHVTDVGGNIFLDTIGALGPVLFGYGWPRVEQEVIRAVRDFGGPAFSVGHFTEIEVAEQLANNIMAIDKVRFCKNGADATQAAVRIARHVTQRKHILCSGYHGHHDWYISSTSKNGGVLSEIGRYTHQFPWGDKKKFAELVALYGHDLAGVIVEIPPLPYDSETQEDDISSFLDEMHKTAIKWDALFILDEVVTGFRYGLGGAGAMYGCTPDLICLGKGMANGYPLAAIGGDGYLMDEFNGGEVFLSTTNGGDVFSLAASRACLHDLENRPHLAQLWRNGKQLGDGLFQIIEQYSLPVSLIGNQARMVMKWADTVGCSGDEAKTFWLAETVKRGVLFGGPIFPTVMMSQQDIEFVLDVSTEAASRMSECIKYGNIREKLDCPVIEDVFSKRYQPFAKTSALSGV